MHVVCGVCVMSGMCVCTRVCLCVYVFMCACTGVGKLVLPWKI